MYAKLVQNYNHLDPDQVDAGMRFEFLDGILASMLYLNIACLLEDAMDEVIESRQIEIPATYSNRKKLSGKIEYFADKSLISDRDGLHAIRKMRNEVGHVAFTARSWTEFDAGLETVGNTLIELGLIEKHKDYEFIAERSAYGPSEYPEALCEATSFVGLNFEGRPAFRYEWRTKVMQDE